MRNIKQKICYMVDYDVIMVWLEEFSKFLILRINNIWQYLSFNVCCHEFVDLSFLLSFFHHVTLSRSLLKSPNFHLSNEWFVWLYLYMIKSTILLHHVFNIRNFKTFCYTCYIFYPLDLRVCPLNHLACTSQLPSFC